MNRILLTGLLILASMTACATLPKPNPKAEAKLQEASPALDGLTTAAAAFYTNLEPLLQDIKELREQPDWNELETLISFTISDDDVGETLPSDGHLQKALDDWSAQWGESGEDLFRYYQSLADRCSISEARRIGLIGRIASLQALYLEVIFIELAENRYSSAEAVYRTVEALTKMENELNSITLDASGLYDTRPIQ